MYVRCSNVCPNARRQVRHGNVYPASFFFGRQHKYVCNIIRIHSPNASNVVPLIAMLKVLVPITPELFHGPLEILFIHIHRHISHRFIAIYSLYIIA
jgi:hypothetical protein